jgi:Icc-related predicted phosphoesterase
MKLLFSTDLHGSEELFSQLGELARSVRPDGLILGGDILPDGRPENVQDVQAGFVLGPLRRFLEELRSSVPMLRAGTVFGNHEMRCAEPAVRELCDAGVIQLFEPDRFARWDDLHIVGYHCTPPCPHWAKDFERLDLPEQSNSFAEGFVWDDRTGKTRAVDAVEYLKTQPSMKAELAEIGPVQHPWILVAHSAPTNLGLDLLDTGLEVGSDAVLDFIKQRQPDLSLHGHTHDAPRMSGRFWGQVGRTIAINPGQGRSRLAAVSFESEDPVDTLVPYGVDYVPV